MKQEVVLIHTNFIQSAPNFVCFDVPKTSIMLSRNCKFSSNCIAMVTNYSQGSCCRGASTAEKLTWHTCQLQRTVIFDIGLGTVCGKMAQQRTLQQLNKVALPIHFTAGQEIWQPVRTVRHFFNLVFKLSVFWAIYRGFTLIKLPLEVVPHHLKLGWLKYSPQIIIRV